MEAGFIDFGKFKSGYTFVDNGRIQRGFVKTSGNSLFIAGMGKIQVHPKATLFGKLGLHRWDIDAGIEPQEAGRDHVDYDDVGVDLFYGIGGEVAPFSNEKIKLRMEYEMFTAKDFRFRDAESGRNIDGIVRDSDFEFISISIIYAF